MSVDHKVPWRSEDDIEATANRVRSAVDSHRFNVMGLLRREYIGREFDEAGILRLCVIPPIAKSKKPFVRFRPFELHLTQQLINAGDLNMAYARNILAHELGHIVMHSCYQHYFSQTTAVKLNFLPNEESSEWQAQCFTGYLLIPDQVLLEQIVNVQEYCAVPSELVFDRKQQIQNRIDSGYYVPQHCLCGASMARRRGLLLTCCGCGLQEQL